MSQFQAMSPLPSSSSSPKSSHSSQHSSLAYPSSRSSSSSNRAPPPQQPQPSGFQPPPENAEARRFGHTFYYKGFYYHPRQEIDEELHTFDYFDQVKEQFKDDPLLSMAVYNYERDTNDRFPAIKWYFDLSPTDYIDQIWALVLQSEQQAAPAPAPSSLDPSLSDAQRYYAAEVAAGRTPIIKPYDEHESYTAYYDRLQDAIFTRRAEEADAQMTPYDISSPRIHSVPIQKYGSRIDIAQTETVRDFIMMEDVPIAKIIHNDPDYADYLLFIFIDERTQIKTYFVITKDSLEYTLKKRDNIFYKCTRAGMTSSDPTSAAYFTLTSFSTLTQSFLLVAQLKSLFLESEEPQKRIFVLVKDEQTPPFRHAITDAIDKGGAMSYVSRTHCNETADAPFYKIYDLYWVDAAAVARGRSSETRKRKRSSSSDGRKRARRTSRSRSRSRHRSSNKNGGGRGRSGKKRSIRKRKRT